MSRETIESMIASEFEAERSVEVDSDHGLQWLQIQNNVDLSEPQQCDHGSYWHNLHIVLKKDLICVRDRKSFHVMAHDEIIRLSTLHKYQLCHTAILRDRLDLVLGCPIQISPAGVALVYLNNFANACFGDPVFRFQVSVGTFGEEKWDVARTRRLHQ